MAPSLVLTFRSTVKAGVIRQHLLVEPPLAYTATLQHLSDRSRDRPHGLAEAFVWPQRGVAVPRVTAHGALEQAAEPAPDPTKLPFDARPSGVRLRH